MFSRYLAIVLCAGVAMLSLDTAVMAQSYPTQPIRIVIGFGPPHA